MASRVTIQIRFDPDADPENVWVGMDRLHLGELVVVCHPDTDPAEVERLVVELLDAHPSLATH